MKKLTSCIRKFDAEAKTATVKAVDEVTITVVNIEGPIETSKVCFWGKAVDVTTFQASRHEPLEDDYGRSMFTQSCYQSLP
jgi:hypothetical protein